MTDSNFNDYEVGYKRPPAQHQFKPGQSGNSKGRPKLIKDFKVDLREELEEIITIQESGKSKQVTKQRVLIKKLLQKAVTGELGALKTIMTLINSHLCDTDTVAEELSDEDKKLLNKYIYKNEREEDDD